jgi:acetolactate synthase-1/2/3 large subunit
LARNLPDDFPTPIRAVEVEPEPAPAEKTGAEIFVEGLLREGVDTVFGYPGGAVIHIYDALFGVRDQIHHILVRHEQGAVHMAQGYARSTGQVGVVLVTSGPGATNCVTGIADANMDSTPIVVFSGQVPRQLIGNDAFQEADIVGITRPCTKHNYLVEQFEDLPRIMAEAFYIARTGRPGPVLVDIPKDLQMMRGPYQFPKEVRLRGYNPNLSGHLGQVKRAADVILGAQKIIVYTGGGVIAAMAHQELTRLVELIDAPCTNTLMGLGAIDGNHPNFVGMLGMHGTYAANMAMDQADLIVAIGARFDDRVTGKLDKFSLGSRRIHIDVDPSSIAKNVRVDVPIVGDVRDVLGKLNAELARRSAELNTLKQAMTPWRQTVARWSRDYPLAYQQTDPADVKPQYVIHQLYEACRGRDTIVTTEVGQHQMWTAQFFRFQRPRQFLTSGGLGTMGYGFPAAIGAQIANPRATVLCVAGDASFIMNVQELATCIQYGIPVKVAIINNGFLGMVRQWQELFHDSRYSQTVQMQPDFVKLAEAFGATGLRAARVEEVRPAIDRMLATPGPVIVDFCVSKEENVYPMVPAGAALSEMLLEPSGEKREP